LGGVDEGDPAVGRVSQFANRIEGGSIYHCCDL
jgi:hypothetical protein